MSKNVPSLTGLLPIRDDQETTSRRLGVCTTVIYWSSFYFLSVTHCALKRVEQSCTGILSQFSEVRRWSASPQSQKPWGPPSPKLKCNVPKDAPVRPDKISPIHKIMLTGPWAEYVRSCEVPMNIYLYFHLLVCVCPKTISSLHIWK
jgi:hypothetical protein